MKNLKPRSIRVNLESFFIALKGIAKLSVYGFTGLVLVELLLLLFRHTELGNFLFFYLIFPSSLLWFFWVDTTLNFWVAVQLPVTTQSRIYRTGTCVVAWHFGKFKLWSWTLFVGGCWVCHGCCSLRQKEKSASTHLRRVQRFYLCSDYLRRDDSHYFL